MTGEYFEAYRLASLGIACCIRQVKIRASNVEEPKICKKLRDALKKWHSDMVTKKQASEDKRAKQLSNIPKTLDAIAKEELKDLEEKLDKQTGFQISVIDLSDLGIDD